MRTAFMKRIALSVFILLFVTGCAATFQEKRDLSKPMVSIAMGKIANNDIQGALLELRRAQRANPEDPEIFYGFALAYWKSDRPESALEHIDKAIALSDRLGLEHPGLKSEAFNLKGTILTGMDSYEEALSSFEEALKDELYATPEYPLYNMSFIHLSSKRYEQAIETATQALDHNPHYAPAWEMLGKIFAQQGKDAQAIEAFKHAILEFPGYVEAHWEIAQLYIRIGETEQGISHLNEVIRVDPGGAFSGMAVQRLQDLGKTPQTN